MTNENADEWVKSQIVQCIQEQVPYFAFARQSYNAGFKAGKKLGFEKGVKAKINVTTISDCPIKPVWHDLRKNPDDLPKGEGLFVVYWSLGKIDGYTVIKGFKNPPKDLHEDIDAWCEIPKFEEGK